MIFDQTYVLQTFLTIPPQNQPMFPLLSADFYGFTVLRRPSAFVLDWIFGDACLLRRL